MASFVRRIEPLLLLHCRECSRYIQRQPDGTYVHDFEGCIYTGQRFRVEIDSLGYLKIVEQTAIDAGLAS